MFTRPNRSVVGLSAFGAFCCLLLCLALAGTPLLATPGIPPAPTLMTLLGSEQPTADAANATEMHYAEGSDIPSSAEEESAVQDSETFTAVADATIIENYPTLNTANTADMWSGRDVCLSVPAGVVRSLVKFDIDALPTGQAISKATLRLYNVNSCGMAGQDLTITPYRLESDWTEGSVTWATQPNFGSGYGGQTVEHGEWGWYEFDVTELVRDWYGGTLANYGLMLRGPEDEAGWRGFFTSEGDEPPELVIEYEVATPLPTETITPTVEPGSWLPVVFADGPAPTPTVIGPIPTIPIPITPIPITPIPITPIPVTPTVAPPPVVPPQTTRLYLREDQTLKPEPFPTAGVVLQVFVYPDSPSEFTYALNGDVGTQFDFGLFLASAAPVEFLLEIIVNGDTIASSEISVDSEIYERYEQSVVIPSDPTTAAGDELVLRINLVSGRQGGFLIGAPPNGDSYVGLILE